MQWNSLVTELFGPYHGMRAAGDFLQGEVIFDGEPLTVIGTTNHAPIGVRLALAQARLVLDTLTRYPGRPILLLIDTQGQQLRRRDELLGINRAMAHLGTCIDLARRRGHRVIGLVYDQALSGGFITSGLIAEHLGAGGHLTDGGATAVAAVAAAAQPGDVVLTAGAGDVTAYGPLIVESLAVESRSG